MESFFVLKSATPKEGSEGAALKFECQICPSKPEYAAGSSSLTNLRSHVKRCHESRLDDYEELWRAHKEDGPQNKRSKLQPQSQPTMSEFFKPKSASPDWSPIVTQSQLDRAVVNFVIDCNAPYQYTERDSFKALVLLGELAPFRICLPFTRSFHL